MHLSLRRDYRPVGPKKAWRKRRPTGSLHQHGADEWINIFRLVRASPAYSQEGGRGHWGLKMPLTAYALEISGVDLPARKRKRQRTLRVTVCDVTGSVSSEARRSKANRLPVHGAALLPVRGRRGPLFVQEGWLTNS